MVMRSRRLFSIMKNIFWVILLSLVGIVIVLAINNEKNMKIGSKVFKDGGNIPVEYTCNGANAQPKLLITEVPDATKSLALIVDDPDAPSGVFVHWTVWNIPPQTATIQNGRAPEGAVEGHTSLGRPGWIAPCPPSGTHRYYFKIYALDDLLGIPESSGKAALEQAMADHVLESATLMGLYSKE